MGSDGVPYCMMMRDSAENEVFVQKGLLTSDNGEPRPLFGRRTSSAAWSYYTTDGNDRYKLPIVIRGRNCMVGSRGCEEVSDGDQVEVQGYSNKSFHVSLLS